MKLHLFVGLFVASVLTAGLVRADERPANPHERKPAAKSEEKDDKKDAEKLVDKLVVTQHTATIGGKDISYNATAGTLVMKDDEGKPKASIFFIAYSKSGE